ncbi:hypothetical protein T05_13377 [Trichinella murrelli]|uniref:Uncharacterized protein n=1 Tax=Trichinella murrelli TaxID=144512 RepID=A0A0V0SP70_9BILA|nr:hypothetical protein T05_13377 [Trichinella murrelli]
MQLQIFKLLGNTQNHLQNMGTFRYKIEINL